MQRFLRATVVIIGNGGTGSYLIDHIGRLFGRYGELRNINHSSIILVDGDRVSDTNTTRQNFGYRSIGLHKCDVLKSTLVEYFGVSNVDAWASFATQRVINRILETVKDSSRPLIIISCVDNHATRNRILSALKPDPDSWDNCFPNNWLYLDSGNSIVDGWTNSLCNYNSQHYGIDMRQQDINMRRNDVDREPELSPDGYEQRGCGAVSSSPRTYWGNQQNAMLLGTQLLSFCKYGKGYGLQAWQIPNYESVEWSTQNYQNHFLVPYTI